MPYRHLVMLGLAVVAAGCGAGASGPESGGSGDRIQAGRERLAQQRTNDPVPRDLAAPADAPAGPAATAAAAPCPDPAEVFSSGSGGGWLCPDAAAAAGLTVVDLGPGWTPRPFAPGADGQAPAFRAAYLDLAAEHSPDGDSLEPEEQFVELYGVVPDLTVIQRRLVDDPRHSCHDAIDSSAMASFTRSLSQANDASIRAAESRRQWLSTYLERQRVRRKLPDLDALERVKALRPRLAAWRKLEAQHAALVAMQEHLLCDGLLTRKHVNGLFTWRTGHAVEMFQRKNFLVPNARFDEETRTALLAGSRELAFRSALRVLRERIADAQGLIEDGTAGDGPRTVLGRQLEPGIMRAAKGYRPLPDAAPDLIGAATEAAALQLGWVDPFAVRTWLARHPGGLRVALALPPVPDYHASHMDLEVEIDRGDVWYDTRPIRRAARRRPALTLFAVVDGQRRPLVRWPTTIGGWADVRMKSGYVVQRWKESDVGKRVWRDLYAAPAWYPPRSTPDRDLVRYLWNGRWRLKTEVFGPGPRSAYGMVMLVHHQMVTRGKRVRFDDNGIRSHGSSSVTSIAHGTSHGCHRLFNHLAVRMGGFLLAHRDHVERGEDRDLYRRTVQYRGRFQVRLDSRGYLYELTPPVAVEVLPGRIRSARKRPPTNSAPARP